MFQRVVILGLHCVDGNTKFVSYILVAEFLLCLQFKYFPFPLGEFMDRFLQNSLVIRINQGVHGAVGICRTQVREFCIFELLPLPVADLIDSSIACGREEETADVRFNPTPIIPELHECVVNDVLGTYVALQISVCQTKELRMVVMINLLEGPLIVQLKSA